MIVNKSELNPLARRALVEIQSAGREITPEIVLWVQDAAERIRKTPLRPISELVDWPIECGGVLLYPLSFGAASWIRRQPLRVQSSIHAIGFACAHSFEPDTFTALATPIKSIAAITRWAMGLKCSTAALTVAIDSIMGSESCVEVKDEIKRKRDEESYHWGAFIRALCTKYPGTSPEYWTWQVSREKSYAMIQQVNEELPDEKQVTEYEMDQNATFRLIVEAIKRGDY